MSDVCIDDRNVQCLHDCPGCLRNPDYDSEPDPDYLYDTMREENLCLQYTN